MGKSIIIDTKFAKRDLQRMKTAIEQLNTVKRQYQNAINNLSALYKGDASAYLQNHISISKMRSVDFTINQLENAYLKLNNTVKKVEAENKKITNIMKG